ncbi:MAG: hypothetical protein HKO73_00075, partial [Woeseiaceae bacterium]|nr:hypothetical protein [Woeseiaceae bacterium]
TLPAGTYVADLHEWRYEDERVDGGDGASSDFPERICFDVTVSPL